MRAISEKLFEVFTRLDGLRFKGNLSTAALVTTKERAPYRVLLVRQPCIVKAGDTVSAHSGEKIILLEHPSDFDWAKSFKAAFATESFTWKRPTKFLDPVSRMLRDVGVVLMGTVYANFDTPVEETLGGLVENSYRFVTGQDVQVDDVIGDKIVKRVVPILGAKVVYVL